MQEARKPGVHFNKNRAAERTVKPGRASDPAVSSASQIGDRSGNMRELTSGLALLAVVWSMFLPFALRTGAQTIGQAMNDKLANRPAGLTFRLSEGVAGAESREKQPLADSAPISNSEAGTLLNRLPVIKSDPDDKAEFAKRIGSLPVAHESGPQKYHQIGFVTRSLVVTE